MRTSAINTSLLVLGYCSVRGYDGMQKFDWQTCKACAWRVNMTGGYN